MSLTGVIFSIVGVILFIIGVVKFYQHVENKYGYNIFSLLPISLVVATVLGGGWAYCTLSQSPMKDTYCTPCSMSTPCVYKGDISLLSDESIARRNLYKCTVKRYTTEQVVWLWVLALIAFICYCSMVVINIRNTTPLMGTFISIFHTVLAILIVVIVILVIFVYCNKGESKEERQNREIVEAIKKIKSN